MEPQLKIVEFPCLEFTTRMILIKPLLSGKNIGLLLMFKDQKLSLSVKMIMTEFGIMILELTAKLEYNTRLQFLEFLLVKHLNQRLVQLMEWSIA